MAKSKQSTYGLMEGLSFSNQSHTQEDQHQESKSSVYQKSVEISSEQLSITEAADHVSSTSTRRSDVHSHQGIKGEKAKRMCIAFSDDNHEFIKRESRRNGMTYSEFINDILNEYRKSYIGPKY